MAKIIPELSDAQLAGLPSQAEAKVYRALRDKLPPEFVVLFQVGWILKREEEQAKDGETDFLICHPDRGFLCVEVKGGGVGFDAMTGDWFSTDRHRVKHSINDPIRQALRAKYSIRSKLNENARWKALSLGNVLRAHAIFLPDIGDANSLHRPDMPASLIGSANTLLDPRTWVDRVYDYWSNDAGSTVPIGLRGIEVVREVFARSFDVKPLVSSRLAEQEARRLELTRDQIRVLDLLRCRRRAAVSGGAGTGKTVLALEKARRLAAEGFRTLLTCYNRQLADHLADLCAGTANLEVMSFHQLCHRQVERARQSTGRNLLAEAKLTFPGPDLFDVQWPNALAYATEVLPERYGAIVCDEGQDFRDEYWVPLELLLTDFDKGPLYVFFDDNQNLYSRAGTFPISDEPFTLSTNCRNTAPIHHAAYKHYKGLPVSPPDIEGEEIQFEVSPSRETQASKIQGRIVDLISRQGVSPGDIAVLIGDAVRKAEYYGILRRLSLPQPAVWVEEKVRGDKAVLLETIQRFKGLESAIVILWGLDTIDLKRHEELIYVGMSRAKSLLLVVGRQELCVQLQRNALPQ